MTKTKAAELFNKMSQTIKCDLLLKDNFYYLDFNKQESIYDLFNFIENEVKKDASREVADKLDRFINEIYSNLEE